MNALHKTITFGEPRPEKPAALSEIQDMVQACMQCGTCSASCPNVHAMDITPRQMWRMLLMGLDKEVLDSGTFWLCSACYTCTLRCPRGLPLTEAVYALKRLAAEQSAPGARHSRAFYASFTDNVRKYGRVQESALMFGYFLSKGSAIEPFKFAPLGMKMLRKGKLHAPSSERRGRLSAMFDKVRKMEEDRK